MATCQFLEGQSAVQRLPASLPVRVLLSAAFSMPLPTGVFCAKGEKAKRPTGSTTAAAESSSYAL
jgi:hypothetical protein